MKASAALVSCTLLIGCAAQAAASENLSQSSINVVVTMSQRGALFVDVYGPEKAKEKVLEAVRNRLKDPASAQFRNVRLVEFSIGQVVCGEVNAKNAFGGYVGFTPFVADVIEVVFWTQNVDGNTEREKNAGLIAACKTSTAWQGPETVRVLVAKQAMSYGDTIKPGNLQWVEWPKAAVPPGAFTSVEGLLGEKGDQRRIVLRSIEPGEPVLEGKITKFGESPRMSMNLGAGMRAVTIRIEEVSGVTDVLQPGDRVDILLTRTQEGQLVSSVILQDITIIAVDQSANSETIRARLGRMVTVGVDTVQAQKLALAQQIGQLSVSLEN